MPRGQFDEFYELPVVFLRWPAEQWPRNEKNCSICVTLQVCPRAASRFLSWISAKPFKTSCMHNMRIVCNLWVLQPNLSACIHKRMLHCYTVFAIRHKYINCTYKKSMIQIYYKYACIGASKHFMPLRMREKPHGRAAENSNGAWIKSLQSGPPGTRLVGNQSFLPWGAAGVRSCYIYI